MAIPEPWRLTDRILYRDIVVAEYAGFRPLTLDVAVPQGGSAPAPVLLFIHGGAWLHGSPKQPADWLMAADPFTAALRAGFAVAFAQYRLSGEARFPAQLDDVRSAVRWLRRAGGALGLDGNRIGVWGESAGGHLASMIALTGTDDDDSHVQAAVCWYAPSNLAHMQRQAHPLAEIDHDAPDAPESLLIGGAVPQHPDLARTASPVTYVSPQAPPMMLVHGDRDLIVPVGQSQELAAALRAVGADVELLVIPDADHCFVGVPLSPIVDTTLAYLSRQLTD
ncbi:alpha/beta hydrolase fold domain-containing protein [Micromonospora krabiensis]|uniref:Acetyl esterase/lipase n=1 Tax=Micromonospora krabiensis TaxID=307121 RepID=A0A1C3MXH8_9ACTN|nr:alpha/beta hydrolase [Micromonospora krabiensis]SBV25046.1 Acetyl esterase/lipase [Micromonospora krabiensis]